MPAINAARIVTFGKAVLQLQSYRPHHTCPALSHCASAAWRTRQVVNSPCKRLQTVYTIRVKRLTCRLKSVPLHPICEDWVLRNLITDVAGLKVGHAQDLELGSGTTVVVFDEPTVASVDVRGGGPGTRETDLLNPVQTVTGIDAIVVSGGSAFGLDAASGVQAWLREQGRGFAIGPARVPIVPGAVLFDLLSGGNKNWGRFPPYRDFGYAAAANAALDFALGSFGAGTGATTVNYKGGLGSASARTTDGVTVGAIAAVNAVGSVVIGGGPWFWAAPFEVDREFGGRGLPAQVSPQMLEPVIKGVPGANTTLVVVATDAILTKAQANRLAVMAQTG